MITAAKEVIQAPERGTYKWQMFKQWADEFRTTHADYVAYIALRMAGTAMLAAGAGLYRWRSTAIARKSSAR